MNIKIKICLKQIRKERNLTIRQLAELAGISRSEISAIETGRIMPTIYVMYCLAVALNVKIDDFIEKSCPS